MNAKTKKRAATTLSTGAGKKLTKLDQVEALLGGKDGASIIELMSATGWQQHSVRGALAGAIRKRGHVLASEKVDGVRRYRIMAR